MQIQFESISELGKPGPKFKKLFNKYWPAYNAWLNSKWSAYTTDLATSKAALEKYMPEMVPTYNRLCKLVNADDVMARFLTGFQPPAYISACSQAVMSDDVIQLVRNYDYHPDLLEGTLLMSSWNGKKVISVSDCIIGAVDGMNEDGLAVSLTFGGRKVVGRGFGIPFIIRYVLEFCSNVEEAVAALTRIPSHMSYNVTVVDKTGAFKTVLLAPDRAPLVTHSPYATNHQVTVDWPENAIFNKTVKRLDYLKDLLSDSQLKADTMADAFLKKPLYNTLFKEGFGTLFTSVYRPKDGYMQLRWQHDSIKQSFDNFTEIVQTIQLGEIGAPAPKESVWSVSEVYQPLPVPQGASSSHKAVGSWHESVVEGLVSAMEHSGNAKDKENIDLLRKKLVHRGEISWEVVADYWANFGKGYWEN